MNLLDVLNAAGLGRGWVGEHLGTGQVRVNGEHVTDPAHQVQSGDTVQMFDLAAAVFPQHLKPGPR